MTKIRDCLPLSSLILDFSMKIYDTFSNSYEKENLKNYLNLNKEIGFIFNEKLCVSKELISREEVLKLITKNELIYGDYSIYGDIYSNDFFYVTEDSFISFKSIHKVIRISCLENFLKMVINLKKEQFNSIDVKTNLEVFKPQNICYIDNKFGFISCSSEVFLEKEKEYIEFKFIKEKEYILGDEDFYVINKNNFK